MRSIIALIVLAASIAHAVPMGARAVANTSGGVTYTARDYVQDGLVAMFDGIENVGYGQHQESPLEWVNLVSGSPFPNFKIESGKRFGSDHLIVAGLTAESLTAWPASFLVIERCYRHDSGEAFFNLNFQTRIEWGLTYAAPGSKFATFSGRNNNSQRSFSYPEFSPGSHNCLSIFYDASGDLGANKIYLNGEERGPTGTGAQSTLAPSLTCIGSRKGVSSQYNTAYGILNCVRVYSRYLTADEVAHNYAVDKARFGLP